MNTRGAQDDEIWRTSVTDLIHLFRDSLVALAPVLEGARFRTEEPDTSNDWDEVADVLFLNIVERSIRWSTEVGDDLSLGHYAVVHTDYDARARIEVMTTQGTGHPLVFHSLVSKLARFDSVSAVTLTSRERVVVTLEGARFTLRRPGDASAIDALTVKL